MGVGVEVECWAPSTSPRSPYPLPDQKLSHHRTSGWTAASWPHPFGVVRTREVAIGLCALCAARCVGPVVEYEIPPAPDAAAADVNAGAEDASSPTVLDASAADLGSGWVDASVYLEVGTTDLSVDDDRAPIFVAFGHGERTIVSCDGGRNWVGERTEALEPPGGDWSHSPHTARALAYADGWFFYAAGWGAPRVVRRSQDGVRWEDAVPRGEASDNWSGTGTGSGVLFGQANRGQRSLDSGQTWEAISPPGDGKGLYAYAEGTTLLVSLGGEALVARSEDDGRTWDSVRFSGDTLDCLAQTRAVAVGSALAGVVAADGAFCASESRGRSWRRGPDVPGGGVRSLVSAGTSGLRAYGAQGTFESKDGRSWLQLGVGPAMEAVTRGDASWVAHIDGQLHFSDDGVTWTRSSAPSGGAPFRHIVFGRARRPAECGR